MKGHLGAVLTSGLAALALALALLQAVVLAHGAPRYPEATATHAGSSHRYSVPGGRSGIPFLPFEKPANPQDREGRTPQRPQEEHRTPPPPRMRSVPPQPGPQAPRKLAA
ncbi:MAG: hypothetical protein ACXWLM_07740 [Myxococcales bacterium]